MGGQPRSTSCFHIQVKKAKDIAVASPHTSAHRAMDDKENPFADISTEQPADVVTSIPAARSSPAEAGVGMEVLPPALHSMHLSFVVVVV